MEKKEVGDIHFVDANIAYPEGIKSVGHIDLQGNSQVSFKKGLREVGNIKLHDTSSLIFPDGLRKTGFIELKGNTSLTLPESVNEVCVNDGMIDYSPRVYLHDSSSLYVKGSLSQNSKLDFSLSNNANLELSEGRKALRVLYLEDNCRASLPNSLKEILFLLIRDNAVLDFNNGSSLEKISELHLRNSTFSLPDSVQEMRSCTLVNSSVNLSDNFVGFKGILELTSNSSVCFPDGFVLKGEDGHYQGRTRRIWDYDGYDVFRFNSVELNAILKEHSKVVSRSNDMDTARKKNAVDAYKRFCGLTATSKEKGIKR